MDEGQAKADAREKFLEQQAARKAKREESQRAGESPNRNEAGTAETPIEIE